MLKPLFTAAALAALTFVGCFMFLALTKETFEVTVVTSSFLAVAAFARSIDRAMLAA